MWFSPALQELGLAIYPLSFCAASHRSRSEARVTTAGLPHNGSDLRRSHVVWSLLSRQLHPAPLTPFSLTLRGGLLSALGLTKGCFLRQESSPIHNLLPCLPPVILNVSTKHLLPHRSLPDSTSHVERARAALMSPGMSPLCD